MVGETGRFFWQCTCHPRDTPQFLPPTVNEEPPPSRLSPLAALIFSSRWLQLPLYLGLIIAQGVYVVLFVKELWQ